jgi:integrase
MRTKKYIIELKILPYFGQKRINDIKAADIRNWQNELIKQGYSPTYLKTINNQLSAVFNYAVKYYDLKGNPCAKAGSMGKSKAEEMNFWTKEEFMQFIDSVMDKRQSYMAFMLLYWTGMRLGEVLALTPADIDFEKRTISITKSYQRLGKQDVITPPKTRKSKRIITIPEFLIADLQDYLSSLYEVKDTDRLLPVTKYYLEHEMKRGIKVSGVKKIRVHDLRHSHASLLVEMGFSPLEIADRLGHEKIETTLNTYSHLYPNKRTVLAEKLDVTYREGL